MSSISYTQEQAPKFGDYARKLLLVARAAVEGNVSFARDIAKRPTEVAPNKARAAHRLSEFAYDGLAKVVDMRHRYAPRHAVGRLVPPMTAVNIAPAGGVLSEESMVQVAHTHETLAVAAETPVEYSADPIIQAVDLSTPPGFKVR